MYGNHSSHTSGFQNSDLGAGGYPYFTAGHHHHHHYHQHQRQPALIGSGPAGLNCPQQAQSQHSTNVGSTPVNNSTNNTSNSNTVTSNNNSSNNSSSNTTNSTNPANIHQTSYTHTSHLYSPSAIEYGITTSSSPTTTDLYFDGGDSQSAIYYGPGQPTPTAPFQENRIISADNGLSYTNLDYAMYHQGQECADGTPSYLAHHHDTKLHLHRYGASATFAGSIADDAASSDNHHHHHHHHLPHNHLHHHPHIAHPHHIAHPSNSSSGASPGANSGGGGSGGVGGGGGGVPGSWGQLYSSETVPHSQQHQHLQQAQSQQQHPVSLCSPGVSALETQVLLSASVSDDGDSNGGGSG
uniref:Uncharacterized protein n=1 Tax=Anopheles dirus TaxID=7168 RepID=A0A182NY83_9DIPT